MKYWLATKFVLVINQSNISLIFITEVAGIEIKSWLEQKVNCMKANYHKYNLLFMFFINNTCKYYRQIKFEKENCLLTPSCLK